MSKVIIQQYQIQALREPGPEATLALIYRITEFKYYLSKVSILREPGPEVTLAAGEGILALSVQGIVLVLCYTNFSQIVREPGPEVTLALVYRITEFKY